MPVNTREHIYVREENSSDVKTIWDINSEAFETDDEAKLVNALRDSGCTFISLVAEENNDVIGHILFTPVKLSSGVQVKILGLAPMAVLTQYQNTGIGSKLVERGLGNCKSHGFDAVVVLGHPDFYPKFGFVPSVEYGIKSEYEVPDEVFMILELVPGSLINCKGIIKYHEVFNEL